MLPIQTERLQLRLMNEQDSPFIIRLLNEPDFLRYIGDKKVINKAQAIAYIENGPLACYSTHGYCLLAVCLPTGQAIGMCGLLKRDDLPFADIGYAFLPEFYGQGYAIEAASGVVEHYPEERPLLALTSKDNWPSQKLLKKLGFKRVEKPDFPTPYADTDYFLLAD